jgi:hypothetical protein
MEQGVRPEKESPPELFTRAAFPKGIPFLKIYIDHVIEI